MAKKVFLGVGHGGSDSGAVSGSYKEKEMNLEMAFACKDELERHGVEVKMSRIKDENDPVSDEIRECNSFNPDLAVDIHNNSGGGDGFEIFYYSGGGLSKVLAKNIEEEIKKMGQNSRGLKTKLNSSGSDYFGFIREIKAPSVIAEGVFIDNKTDMTIADTKEKQRKFGVAYAKGILKTLGIEYKEINSGKDDSGKYYRVIVGSFTIKSNAEKLIEKLKDHGYSAFIATFKKDGVNYYRAVAGSFKERKNADKQVEKLKKEGYEVFIEIFEK